MNKFAEKLVSERFVIWIILINSLSLFLLGFVDGDRDVRWALLANIDHGCVIFFIFEALIKIKLNGFKAYWASNWNKFDFIIVSLSTPVLFESVLPTSDFKVLLLLRLGRLFRLFRLLKFIPNKDHLIQGINRALRASIGILLALFLVIIILSIAGTYLFKDKAPEHFGNPLLSCYSIFKVCTVEGWYEIPDQLVKDLEQDESETRPVLKAVFIRLFFILSVISMGIVGLSLANAIFIDEMTVDNTRFLEEKVDKLHEEILTLKEIIRNQDRSSG